MEPGASWKQETVSRDNNEQKTLVFMLKAHYGKY